MTQQDSARPPRFCPNCGAHNLALAAICTVCGQSLGKGEDFAKLWGAQSQQNAETEVIDLYPTYDVSSQTTTPFTQTRPFDPNDYKTAPANRGAGDRGLSNPVPPVSPPQSPPIAPVAHRRKGPPGCLLGCFALILIGLVVALLAVNVVRDEIGDRVGKEITSGVSSELQQIDDLPIDAAGQFTLTQAEINSSLQQNAALYAPIEDLEVEILPQHVTVRFKLYGLSSTFRGGLEVTNGQVVVSDPVLSGPAGQIIDAAEIAKIFELQTGALLTRFGLEPVAVQLRKGSIEITTDEAAPAASWTRIPLTPRRDHMSDAPLPSTRTDLMERIERAWNELDHALVDLDAHQLDTKPASGGWSIKDHLAHITVWTTSASAILKRQDRSEIMGVSSEAWSSGDEDVINAEILDHWGGRQAADVLTALHHAQAELRSLISAIDDDDLSRPYSHFFPEEFPAKSTPVIEWIIGNSYEHIDLHLPEIKRLRAEVD